MTPKDANDPKTEEKLFMTEIKSKSEMKRLATLNPEKAVEELERLRRRCDSLEQVLESVRSQMCWERDRDELSMGFCDLHDAVTKVLANEGGVG